MKVTDCIECPKCHTRFLKKLDKPHGMELLRLEWFCHRCKDYFSTHELVHQWGLDAGDLFGDFHDINDLETSPLRHMYSEFAGGEPLWYSKSVRESSYEVVSNIYAGISEMEAFELWKKKLDDNDYADLIATQEDALGIGLQ